LRFSPDGRLLAGASLDGSATVWDLRGRTTIATFLPGAEAMYTLGFSNDGKMLAVGDSTGTVTLYDIGRRAQVGRALMPNGGGATGISFSPGDSTLVVAGGDGALRLWDVATHKLVGTLPGSTSGGSVSFFPTDEQILGVFGSGTGVIWTIDPANWEAAACRVAGRELTRSEWHEFLPDRRYGAVCP
jgi:WD40 repeat protein